MKKSIIRVVLVCLTFFLVNTVYAVEIAGVGIPETIEVTANNTPSTLKLNGAGIRTKVFFKVYIAALYLTETKNTAKDVFNVSGPKQINLTMLRNIKSASLSEAFNEGIKKNTDKEELEKLDPQFRQMDQLFTTIPELKKDDIISIRWVPNEGTKVLFNGKEMSKTFPNGAFFNALLRIWLGEDPASTSLKNQLLGESVDR